MVELIEAETGCVLVARVDVAGGFGMRAARGLIGRDGLPHDAALLLSDPLHCIHTFGMRFAIDIVFLDRALVVVGVAGGVQPRRFRWHRRGCHQLELAAGRASAMGLSVGTRVRLRASRASEGGHGGRISPQIASPIGGIAHQPGQAHRNPLDDVPTLPPPPDPPA